MQANGTSYLKEVWDRNDWLHEGQYGFRPGFSCESQVISVCRDTDIADSLGNGARLDTIITDFSKIFYIVPHYRLLTKFAASGVELRVVVWIRVVPRESEAEENYQRTLE